MANQFPTAVNDATSLTWAGAQTDDVIQADDAKEIAEAQIAVETKVGKGASTPGNKKVLVGTSTAGETLWQTIEAALPAGVAGYALFSNGSTVYWDSPSAGAGENNTGTNLNTAGVGVYHSKTGVVLGFKGVESSDSKVGVSDNTTNKTIDLTVNESNLLIQNMGGTSLPVNRGGTGATTASGARGNLELDQVTNDPQVILQSSTPGTAQTGNFNISGKAKSGSVETNTAKIGTLNGILKASSGNVAGSATTDDLTEGGNLYFTNARVRTNKLNQMGAPDADVNFNSVKIINLADPINPQDAATKAYVDALKQGLDPKDSVKVVATTNIDLATGGLLTIDGVTVADGDRVLVIGQTAGAENGIYVATTTAWTRASDANTSAKVTSGLYAFVEQGTDYGDSGWILTTNGTITLDTTALNFTQFSGAGQITAGNGMTKTGNTLDVVGTAGRISVGANSIDIDSGYVGQTSITTLGTIAVGTWNGTLIGETYGGTGQNAYVKGDILAGTGTNTLGKLALGSNGQVLSVSTGSATGLAWTNPARPVFDAVVHPTAGVGDYQTIYAAFGASKYKLKLMGAIVETELIDANGISGGVALVGEGRQQTSVTFPNDTAKRPLFRSNDSYFEGFTLKSLINTNLSANNEALFTFWGQRCVLRNLGFSAQSSTTTTTGSMVSLGKNGTNFLRYSTVEDLYFDGTNNACAYLIHMDVSGLTEVDIDGIQLRQVQRCAIINVAGNGSNFHGVTIANIFGSMASCNGNNLISISAGGSYVSGTALEDVNLRIDSTTGGGSNYAVNWQGTTHASQNQGNISRVKINKTGNKSTENWLGILVTSSVGVSITNCDVSRIRVTQLTYGTVTGNTAYTLELQGNTTSFIGNSTWGGTISDSPGASASCSFIGNAAYDSFDFGNSNHSNCAFVGNVSLANNVNVNGNDCTVVGNSAANSITISGNRNRVGPNRYNGSYTDSQTISGENHFLGTLTTGFRNTTGAASTTLDMSKANLHRLLLNASITTLTMSNVSAKGCVYSFIIKQDATGSRTIAWPASVVGAPTLSTAANAVDFIEMIYEPTDAKYYVTSSRIGIA